LIIVLILILFSGLAVFKGWVKSDSIGLKKTQTNDLQTPAPSPTPAAAVKNDLAALEKYCMEEVLKLPGVPFTYKSKDGPTRSGPMPWLYQYIPDDVKESEKVSCTLAYRFDGRTAYSSVGASYPGEIKEFDRAVLDFVIANIDSSWTRVSKVDESTLIYKRENKNFGTQDFVDVFDGGLVIYIKFDTYL